jgi:hypothetical protein
VALQLQHPANYNSVATGLMGTPQDSPHKLRTSASLSCCVGISLIT